MDTNTDTNMNLHSDSESNTGKEFHTVAYTDTRRIPEVMVECQNILWLCQAMSGQVRSSQDKSSQDKSS